MCVFDETGAKFLLDDEIFVATERTPLSAKVFGDVGGRFQARSAFQRAFVSVCLRDGSAYGGAAGWGNLWKSRRRDGSAYGGRRRRGETRKTGATSAACGEYATRRLGARFGRADPGIGSTIDVQSGDVSRPTGCRVALCGVMPLR